MVLSVIALASLLAATAIFAYVLSSIQTASRLQAFPGPRLGSFSYLWMARNALSGRMGQIYYREASLRYGDVVRIGPRELITSDPDLVRRLSATRPNANQYHRSSWYALNRLDPYEDSMFSLRDDVAHDRLKARTAAAYAGRENPALESEVDTVVRELVSVLRATATGSQSGAGPMPIRAPAADLAVLAQYFTLDSITRVAFGSAFGFLARQEDVHAYLQSIREIAPFMVVSAEVPCLANIVSSPLVLRLAGPKLTDKKGIGRLMRDIVAERFAPGAKAHRDMLGAFIRNGLTQRQCETEALFQIVAGSDTTATAIRMALLYAITTPRVYQRLQAEVDAVQDQISADDVMPNAVAEKLPYLQAVIWEGLRIHPPFVGLPFKEVPAQGDTINGHFVPGGTRIAPSIWALMRRADIFGADVDVFCPERWLQAGTENADLDSVNMRRTVELVFGYGRWACAGKSLALLELNKVIAELFRRFDFQLVNVLNPVTSINFNLFLQSNMWVCIANR